MVTAVIGCLTFIAGMWLLFWNEGRAVQTTRSLDEVMDAVISFKSTSEVLEENNLKLVHISGPLELGEPLTEVEYGVAVSAVKLKRRVQMYQWIEEEHKSPTKGDETTETTYSYSVEWKDKLIDSSSFYIKTGHHNPKGFSLKSTIYISEQVNIGKYFFGPALKDKFLNFILFTSDERPERRDIKLHSGLYYHSQDVWNPEVGDIRVQFSYAGKAGDVVSVIGMQVGQELQPYQTIAGDEILILRTERLTVEDMFLEEHAQNWFLTWMVRGIGWMLMFIGANCITELLCAAVSRFSFLHDVLVLGLASINLAVSMSVSLIVIALAWVWYRPMLGFCFIVAASMPFIYSAIIVYRSDQQETTYRRL